MQYSSEEKAGLLEEWRRSGKSISAYVREKGLVRWTFTKWLKAERETKPCFVEVAAPVMLPEVQAPPQEILIEKGEIKIHVPLCVWAQGAGVIMEGLRRAL
jgi:transposase-like protein